MTPQNLSLINQITSPAHDTVPLYSEPTIALTTRDLYGDSENVHTLWHSPTGFGAKDDAVMVGYLRLPACVRLDGHKARCYRLASISTTVTSKFSLDYNLVLEVPAASVDHQRAILPYLFIK